MVTVDEPCLKCVMTPDDNSSAQIDGRISLVNLTMVRSCFLKLPGRKSERLGNEKELPDKKKRLCGKNCSKK